MIDDRDNTTHFGRERTQGTATAAAKQPFDEETAKTTLTPFEQKLTNFINRRINAEPSVVVSANGRKVEVLEYMPAGDGLGHLKVQAGLQMDAEWIEADETLFEMLLVKIIHD